jgi:AraC-like DNA-binding protein/mannose-6-phosphate isomerase-like protein (cupin superfamily)
MKRPGREFYLHSDLIIEYKKDAPQSFAWESHFHPGCQIYFVHSGQGQMLLDDQLISFETGYLALIDALRLHYITPHSPSFLRSIIHFLPSWLEESVSLPIGLNRLLSGSGPLILSLTPEQQKNLELKIEYLNTQYCRWQERADSLLETELKVRIASLLFDILNWMEKARKNKKTANPFLVKNENAPVKTSLAEQMTRYIASQVYEKLDLQSLQEEFKFSIHHLTHHFKEITGISPMRFWRLCQIKEAKRLLLHTDLTISEIADKLKFGTSQYFSQTFKQWVKLTPSEFRKISRSPRPKL